mmetsp:Transcript_15708/g.26184  ORF Transcript_15708/g.26184 Transcript_15708/m.26184 type:complete len:180 (-) Transcript_15708:2284-2823(-)|eukprot:CAMPEP_0114421828 /NCGR_PEP_ID=MMETSP0103-20121206/5288_1 /TAXON_ID=37642 ORGANISM="Paraphysomonas imperforata, Strain PA2" /NCGR_SAMPLE_ID=MMETSP0103 /ASSEMBLY_ACC=CAM_ASM_000201 /LENGTH=179 /DNA_ID=CAMNT_0001590379 /DNA_START=118 /DNA_END=657 /DNA_ORIENTATION=+
MDRGNRFSRMNIRVYGQSMAVTHSHGYLVDDFPTGLSDPVGDIVIDPRKSTFVSLRPLIMYNTTGHMHRRSLMFQETLFIMSRLPNLYDRPKPELTMWQYGYVKKDDAQVKLIHPDKEEGTIGSIIPEIFKHDLVIVPLSQIPPAPPVEEATPVEEEENTDTNQKQKGVAMDKSSQDGA